MKLLSPTKLFFYAILFTSLLCSTARAGKDIVDTAVSAGSFKTLAAALQAADLVDALKGDGPFTVFAPTDEAFAKLPKGTVESLLKPENKSKLAAILKYHVVAGRVYAEDALRVEKATTLQGQKVRISANDLGAQVNEANLIATDIAASNGVIHVIDAVLLPSGKKLSAAEARRMIEHTISRGVHLFNSGHHASCASLQRHEKVLAGNNRMSPQMKNLDRKSAADLADIRTRAQQLQQTFLP